MAAKFSGTAEPSASAVATPLAAYGAALTIRRAALGNPELPRNTGTRRTASKAALLRAIAAAGGDW